MICATRRRASAALAFVTTTVASSLALAMGAPTSPEDIRDIQGPIAIPPWWRWPLAMTVAGVAALAVGLVVRWWRARSARPLTPLESAQKALSLAEAHAREGRSRAWAEVVAETMRSALALRLGTEVLPQTTAELTHAPWAKPPLSEDFDATRLLEILQSCDLARFAKATLETDALLASTALAREVAERLLLPPAKHPSAARPQPQTVAP